MNDELRRKDDELVHNLERRLDAHLATYSSTDKEVSRLTKTVEEIKHTHLVDNAEIAKFQSAMTYVLYGNKENNEVGMKDKVDEIHALLVQAKAVGGIFGGVKALAGWLLIVGALVALMKGWLAGLLAWAIVK